MVKEKMKASFTSSPFDVFKLNGSVRSVELSFAEKFFTLLVFLYWLVYENVLFFYSIEYGGTAFFILTNGIKLFLPFILLLYAGLPSSLLLIRGNVGLYIFFFLAFLLWALLPTLISGDLMSWFKLLPRFIFFLSLVALLSRKPTIFLLFAKFMVLYVLFALLQYIFIYLTGAYNNPVSHGNQLMAGPFGLFGNVVAMMSFPGAPYPFIRLTGFWNEPSNASASAFAAFFLARYLVIMGEGEFWRKSSYACLVTGILTLSNAGYFALGAALFFGLFFGASKFTAREFFRFAILLLIVVILLWIVFFGRTYVAENLTDNAWMRAIVGLRELESQSLDFSGGRLEIMQKTLNTASEGIIGIGIQDVSSEEVNGSGTAPLLWLLLTGIPGLFLLLCRETILLISSRSLFRRLPTMLPLIQALVVIVAQHLVYGSWMNPNYLILAAMVLVSSRRATQQLLTTNRPRHDSSQ
jgi:hypothetical protein